MRSNWNYNLALISQINAIIFNTVPGNIDAFSKILLSLKFPSPPFTHIHFHFLPITESPISQYRYNISKNMAGDSEVTGDTTATAAVWVASSCCRVTPHDRSFVWVAEANLSGCRLHSNEEVEMAVRDRLEITRYGFLPRSKIQTHAKMWQMHQWARVQCWEVIILQGNKWVT